MRKVLNYFFGFVAIAGLGLVIKEKVIDAYFDPVNHYIESQASGQRWGTKIELVPEIFTAGDDIINVRTKLMDSGYKQLSEETIWGRYRDKIGPNREAYMQVASTLVCNVERYVFLEFDTEAKLLNASAAVNERGCL